jgi:hypothetical protein
MAFLSFIRSSRSKYGVVIRLAALVVLAFPIVDFLAERGMNLMPIACAAVPKQKGPTGAASHNYTTNFPNTENPISEGNNWTNGKAVGLDWADVATIPGLAYGTESGSGGYDDSTAILNGTWGPDQTVEATVHSVHQTEKLYEEVEIRLRSAITAHKNTGYEINFRCLKTGAAYTQIVRWNGPLGNFTYVASKNGAQYGVTEGDVVKATIVGNVITVYINGNQVLQATDGTYSDGNPGMGFYLQSGSGVNQDYGFSKFTASDGASRPVAPTKLSSAPH